MGIYDLTIPFFVLLGILIFVHEFGHFIVAKKFGIKVLKFSLGFGPAVLKKKMGETEYMISAIPLGGYVKLFGMEPNEEVPEEEKHRSFNGQSVWRRIGVVAAGPIMNIVLAFLFFTALGMPVTLPIIGNVFPDMPASRAGIKPGDRVETINGKAVDTWDDLAEKVAKSGGQQLELEISREGKLLKVTVVPEAPNESDLAEAAKGRALIGIKPSADALVIRKESLALAPWIGAKQTALYTWKTVDVLYGMLTLKISPRGLGGPIAIAKMAGESAKAGLDYYLFLVAFLSVNLAVLNFLPIPVLDGGHIFFFLLEFAMGRPVSLRNREIAQQVGMAILLLLMIFVICNDIVNISG